VAHSRWTVVPGAYEIQAGASIRDIRRSTAPPTGVGDLHATQRGRVRLHRVEFA
jgi:hypothetical protein